MDIRFTPVAAFTRPRWTPLAEPFAPLSLGQAAPAPQTPPTTAPVPAPVASAPVKAPFIDSAIFGTLFDVAIVVAGAIAGNVFWKTAKEKTAPADKASEKRKAYFFYGLAGIGAVKAVLDSGRIMR